MTLMISRSCSVTLVGLSQFKSYLLKCNKIVDNSNKFFVISNNLESKVLAVLCKYNINHGNNYSNHTNVQIF